MTELIVARGYRPYEPNCVMAVCTVFARPPRHAPRPWASVDVIYCRDRGWRIPSETHASLFEGDAHPLQESLRSFLRICRPRENQRLLLQISWEGGQASWSSSERRQHLESLRKICEEMPTEIPIRSLWVQCSDLPSFFEARSILSGWIVGCRISQPSVFTELGNLRDMDFVVIPLLDLGRETLGQMRNDLPSTFLIGEGSPAQFWRLHPPSLDALLADIRLF